LIPLPGHASVEKALAAADKMEDFLLGGCDACMPKKRPEPAGRCPVYWWSDEIAELRRSSANNVAYHSLLKMDVPPGVQLIGFTDDLAIVGTAVSGQLLEDLVNPVLQNIDEWMSSHGLELAHQKTEAVILSKRRAFVPPRLSIGGHQIPLYEKIR